MMTGYASKRAAAQDKLAMTKDEALKLALEALESIEWHDGGWGLNPDLIETAITAINEALAQPAQEPPQYSFKAYWAEDGRIGVVACIIRPDGGPHIMSKFIDPPQPAQEPVAYLCRLDEHGLFDLPTPDKACEDCFPVYAAPPQPAQEPVTWMGNKDFEPIRVRIMQEAYELADRNDSEGYNAIKAMCGDVQRMLPPQRTWVGLTDEEIKAVNAQVSQIPPIDYTTTTYAKAIEAKLKEKNT